jgi:putative transposase
MSRYKIKDQHGLNFITLTVVDWVDVFIRKSYKDIILDSLPPTAGNILCSG